MDCGMKDVGCCNLYAVTLIIMIIKNWLLLESLNYTVYPDCLAFTLVLSHNAE